MGIYGYMWETNSTLRVKSLNEEYVCRCMPTVPCALQVLLVHTRVLASLERLSTKAMDVLNG